METLDYWCEPFFAGGGAAGKGILKNLGTPPLEKLELFTREVIQNCWDAADPLQGDTVSVTISCEEIDEERVRRVRSELFNESHKELGLGSAFRESPRLLRISDRGTHGLGGPTRSDIAVDGPTDFRDFLRNVGEPPDKDLGGGSFGFGKAALYLVSLAHCIVVHTRAKNEFGALETRLMGAGLSAPFSQESNGERLRYTGRHAWGIFAGDEFVEPVRGSDCEYFASLMGLDTFGVDETGTDIVIVAPDLSIGGHDPEDVSPSMAMDLVSRAIAWHFWPKIYGPNPAMEISVLLDGEEVPIPGPADDRRLAAFVSAMYALDGKESPTVPGRTFKSKVEVGIQKTHVGDVCIQSHLIPDQGVQKVPIAAPDGDEPLNHVALMRNAELVVRYVKGPELPAGSGGYAGVFRVKSDDVALDKIFRASEPPSHDDWIPQALSDRTERMYVNMAVRRVGEYMNQFVDVETPSGGSGEDVPLGQFSRQLASLVPSVNGEGAKKKGAKPGSSGPRASSPIEVTRQLAPSIVDGEVQFESSVRARKKITVSAIPAVVSDGTAAEKSPPEGAMVPKILKWRGPMDREVESSQVQMDAGEDWTVVVSSPGDSMVRVQFEVED